MYVYMYIYIYTYSWAVFSHAPVAARAPRHRGSSTSPLSHSSHSRSSGANKNW